MDIAYLFDWLNLLLRWAHVITAVAWIGASFYFVMLDNSLSPPTHDDLKKKGVDGEMWAVHGGGFYHSNKYMVAPRWLPLPQNLHWSYWESYSTWLTGFGLFTTLYLYNAGTFLVDKTVCDWTPGAAIGAALGFLAAFCLIYDGICRTLGQRKNGDIVVGICVFVFVVFASWLACQLFAGRAAFLLVGAMLATAMSANVFFWIIPGQRKVVAAMTSGQPYDANALAIHGKRGKQRSVHNTYFTLPVLIAMLSNHYSFLYSHPQRWMVLVLMMLAGALIRQFFVQRHGWRHGRASNPWPFAAAGVVILLGVIAWMRPAPAPAAAAAPAVVDYAQLKPILEQRCYSCHGEAVQMKNLRLDSAESVKSHAQQIYQQVVVTKIMPLSNATQMTDTERHMVARWFEGQGSRP